MLRSYLWSHRGIILYFLVCCGIVTVLMELYSLPLAAVLYMAAVCGGVGLLFLTADYLRFYRRQRQLEALRKEILVTLDTLPEPGSVLEASYQELLRALFEEKERLLAAQERKYEELLEYFGMWVHQTKTPIAASRLILQSARERKDKEAAGFNLEYASDEGTLRTDSESKDMDAVVKDVKASPDAELSSAADITDLEELNGELQRIEQYVEMVMCYLRLNTDSTDYVFRECSLDAVICQAVRRYASAFIRKKLQLCYEPTAARVVTDEKWLQFVLEQLLSNALKYTKEGAITITLEEPKTLCIQDTGIGIAPEDLPRICEKGYTGGNGRADKQASGIGLYLCSRICRNLGHRLTITSEPGVGTRVQLDLQQERLE